MDQAARPTGPRSFSLPARRRPVHGALLGLCRRVHRCGPGAWEMRNFRCARCQRTANTANTTYWWLAHDAPKLCARCDPPTKERVRELVDAKNVAVPTPGRGDKEGTR